MNKSLIEEFYHRLNSIYRERIDKTVEIIVQAKEKNEKVVVATGSGPNIHEGVTTLIAELINKNIIDGVLTSSAVIAHEMAGCLDRVTRYNAANFNFKDREVWLPKGDIFEITEMSEDAWAEISNEMVVDHGLISEIRKLEGETIIKAAGNMAYPMGLRTEILSQELLEISRDKFGHQFPLEYLAGLGADERTMIGAGAKRNVPVLVSIPQLVGGGVVGIAIGDSISINDRCIRNAKLLGSASVIIESGLALAQEIHDGPFETYTGHGIWAQWCNEYAFSLKGKNLIRIDLDENLEKVWQQQRNSGLVQSAIAEGKPKTKLTGVPFRMEMSGFARLESSIPLVGDVGEIWPVIASKVADRLNVKLDFMSYKQEKEEGIKMREWIVKNVHPVKKETLKKNIDSLPVVL